MSENIFGKYKLVLGLEIHLHLKTGRKMFCRCDADVYDKEPNTSTCPTCLGLPGALPVPNALAVRKAQILGLALNSKVNKEARFDRKHYFYPDLPKGYQISQYKHPLCTGGYMDLKSGKSVSIERVHLEEDTAKSMHEGDKTLIDFNVSSIPLAEIVTEPVFENVEDAVEFSKAVQGLVRELGLGDADMEKGQMRLEPNISLRTVEMEKEDKLPAYKVEIKNINSFKFMEKAVTAEVKRQRVLLDKGETPVQENRGYIEESKTTVSQRGKEQAHDYRYFPEPDIPPLEFDESYVKSLKHEFESLAGKSPSQKKATLVTNLNVDEKLKEKVIQLLTVEEIEKIMNLVEKEINSEKLVNIFLNKKEVRKMTHEEITKMFEEEKDKVSDENLLREVVGRVIEDNKDAVESYKKGKDNALQFLVGMIMRETKGKAEVETAKKLLLDEIK